MVITILRMEASMLIVTSTASDFLIRIDVVTEIGMDTVKNMGTVASTPTMTSTGTKRVAQGMMALAAMVAMVAMVATIIIMDPGEGETVGWGGRIVAFLFAVLLPFPFTCIPISSSVLTSAL